MTTPIWEVATDPRAPLGLRRVSRTQPAQQPTTNREGVTVWALRSLAVVSGAGLCCISSDQPMPTIIVGGAVLLSVLVGSCAALDWLEGGESRARVRVALLVGWQVLCVMLAILLLPVALPLSRWLQARSKRGGWGR